VGAKLIEAVAGFFYFLRSLRLYGWLLVSGVSTATRCPVRLIRSTIGRARFIRGRSHVHLRRSVLLQEARHRLTHVLHRALPTDLVTLLDKTTAIILFADRYLCAVLTILAIEYICAVHVPCLGRRQFQAAFAQKGAGPIT